MKPFQKLEDFLGTWTQRNGKEINITILTITPFNPWDEYGNYYNDPQKDLMERKREAKL